MTPSATTPRDVVAILEAGWSAAAVQDAVLVCAYSNMMNRIVEGLGLTANGAMLASAADRLKDSYLADYSEMPKLTEADAAMKQHE